MNMKIDLSDKEKADCNDILRKAFEEYAFHESVVFDRKTYNDLIVKIRGDFREKVKSRAQFYFLMVALRSKSSEIIEANNLDVVLPQLPATFIDEPGFRSATFFENGTAFYPWLDAFRERMSADSLKQIDDPIECLGLALFSAMTLGGLYDGKKIVKLAQILTTEIAPLKCLNGQTFFDFEFKVHRGEYTILKQPEGDRGDSENYDVQRWWADPCSLGLIHNFLKLKVLRPRKVKPLSEQVKGAAIFQLIKTAIMSGQQVEQTTLRQLIDGAIYISPGELGHLNSEMLHTVARGDYITHSLDENSLKQLLGRLNPLPNNNVPSDLESTAQNYEVEKEIDYKKLPEISGFYEDIVSVLNKYEGTQNFVNGREEFEAVKDKHTAQSKLLLLICDYMTARLDKANNLFSAKARYVKSKGIEISTLKTYFHYLAPLWFPEMVGRDLKSMSSSDYLVAYENMIDRVSTEKSKNIKITLIKQMHELGVNHPDYNLPNINNLGMLDSYRNETLFKVRTQIVNHRHIKTATTDLLLGETLTRDQKVVCRVMLLAFRTAMRRGEILKLRIQDVEPSGIWWADIVNNKYGKNKTDASKRSLPLKLLMHPDEFAEFELFYNSRKAEAKKSDLLFGYGTMNVRLPDKFVTGFSQLLLRSASGDMNIVFHSLRHTAANMMHAVVEEDYELARMISGLSKCKLRKIRHEIVGPDHIHLSGYWELAGFLGHSSPRITFSSYLHLTDYIYFRKLMNAKLNIPKSGLLYLSKGGSSQRSIKGELPLKDTSFPAERLIYKKEGTYLKYLTYLAEKNHEFYAFSIRARKTTYDADYEQPNLKEGLLPDYERDFTEVWKRLSDYQNGMSISEVYDTFGFPEAYLKRYVGRAQTLYTGEKYVTENDKPRAQCNGNSESLASERKVTPSRPHLKTCRIEADKALKLMLQYANDLIGKCEVQDWVQIILSGSTVNGSYVTLKSIKAMQFLTSTFNRAFDQRRWYLRVFLNDTSGTSELRQKWEKGFPRKGIIEFVEKDARDYGEGTAHLYYQEADFKRKLNDRKRIAKEQGKIFKTKQLGSDQLKYISQMLFIML